MICHIDADSFFASVIIRTHPEHRGKALLAVGMGGGCVIAATYEAKAKGVKTGMPVFEARKLCPGAIEMCADFRETAIASEQIESIIRDNCPIIEQYSIDEWFLDLKSLVGGVPKNAEIWGKEIQKEILLKTSLSVSIGIAGSKLLAKMAGEYKKPAGVTVVFSPPTAPTPNPSPEGGGGHDIESFLKNRSAAAIPGIGRQREAKAETYHWKTAWDIATADKNDIIRVCGRPGLEMQRELLGEPVAAVSTTITLPKSISRCRSFKTTNDAGIGKAHLLKHLEYCTLKMRRHGLGCSEVSLWVRSPEFAYKSTHRKLGCVCITVDQIAGPALSAFSSLARYGQRFNQIGLALSGLKDASTRQQSLFEDPKKARASENLQSAMDTLHNRFGRDSITRGTALAVRSGTKQELDLPIVE